MLRPAALRAGDFLTLRLTELREPRWTGEVATALFEWRVNPASRRVSPGFAEPGQPAAADPPVVTTR